MPEQWRNFRDNIIKFTFPRPHNSIDWMRATRKPFGATEFIFFAISNSFQMIIANERPAKRDGKGNYFKFIHRLWSSSLIHREVSCVARRPSHHSEWKWKFIEINCIRTTIRALCHWHKFKFLFERAAHPFSLCLCALHFARIAASIRCPKHSTLCVWKKWIVNGCGV